MKQYFELVLDKDDGQAVALYELVKGNGYLGALKFVSEMITSGNFTPEELNILRIFKGMDIFSARKKIVEIEGEKTTYNLDIYSISENNLELQK